MTRRWPAAALLVLLPASVAAQSGPAPADSAASWYEAGRFRAAEPALLALAARRPADAGVHYRLGRARLALGRYQEAVRSFERAIAGDSALVVARIWLARAVMEDAKHASVFRRPGLAGRVRRELEGAVATAPRDLEARRALLTFYLNAPGAMGGGRDKAEAQARALAALDACHGHLGRAEIHRKDEAAAEADALRAAITACPDSVEGRAALARLLERQGRAAEAADALDELARRRPDIRRTLFDLGRLGAGTGARLELAEAAAVEYLREEPRDDDPSHVEAEALLRRIRERRNRAGG